MKHKTWCLALALCMLALCSCSTPQSNATEMERAITSFLEEAEANAGSLSSASEGFISYGTYRCNSKYYNVKFFQTDPEGIPAITLDEDGKCQLTVNYMQGVAVIGGVYLVEDKQVTVTLTDYGDSIFYEGDGYLEKTFVFTIIDDRNLVIEKGYYGVYDGDYFTKEMSISEKKGSYTTADCESLLESSIEELAVMFGVNLADEPSGGILLEGRTLTAPVMHLNGKLALLTPYTIQAKEASIGILLYGEPKETTPIAITFCGVPI